MCRQVLEQAYNHRGTSGNDGNDQEQNTQANEQACYSRTEKTVEFYEPSKKWKQDRTGKYLRVKQQNGRGVATRHTLYGSKGVYRAHLGAP